MKKIVLLTGIAAMTVMMSCKKEEPAPPPPPAPIIVHETVIEPAPVPPPPPPVEERVNKDGTSISVSTKGVSLDTKKGKKSTTVTVKDGEAAIDINK